MTYAQLPATLFAKLRAIRPSHGGRMLYYPCRVELRDGRRVDRVYVQPIEPYLSIWGLRPEQDPAKRGILVEEIVDLEESPTRLPPELADTLYQAGESGMGYLLFYLEFRDGSSLSVVAGNAIDFVPLPNGQRASDIVAVRPHKGRGPSAVPAPDYYWALFEDVAPPT